MFDIESFISIFQGASTYYTEVLVDESSQPGEKRKASSRFIQKDITDTEFIKHLKGKAGLGISPIDESNLAQFGVVDIDVYAPEATRKIIRSIYTLGLPFFPCRSKSGGLHIYIFFKKKVQASSVVDVLEKFVSNFGLRTLFDTKVEIFPKQTRVAPGKHGNTITLPYLGGLTESPISYGIDANGNSIPVEEFTNRVLRNKVTVSELVSTLDDLPYADAPPCVQRGMLVYNLGENSGRNNFLFTASIFLKKKYGKEQFGSYAVQMNDEFDVPLETQEVDAIVRSIQENEYNYRCRDIPCLTLCDSKLCRTRTFGVGKDKGFFTGLDYGTLKRIKSAKPYYLWELRPMGAEKFVEVRFDDESNLMDQRYFMRMCIRYLNMTPTRIDENEWLSLLNKALASLVEVEVPKSTDTSEIARLNEMFVRYLTQRQLHKQYPQLIKTGFVYKDSGKYYFITSGFETFLELNRVRLSSEINLRELLLSFGCKDSVLTYVHDSRSVSIPCWVKEEDETLSAMEGYFDDVLKANEEMLNEALAVEKSEEVTDEDLNEVDF